MKEKAPSKPQEPFILSGHTIHANSSDLRTFRLSLNDVVKKDMKSNKENVVDPVLNVELMSKASIYKFQGNVLSPFIKITLAIPRLIAAVKRLVSGGDVPGVPSTTRVRSPCFFREFR